jgi:hypothetical protein
VTVPELLAAVWPDHDNPDQERARLLDLGQQTVLDLAARGVDLGQPEEEELVDLGRSANEHRLAQLLDQLRERNRVERARPDQLRRWVEDPVPNPAHMDSQTGQSPRPSLTGHSDAEDRRHGREPGRARGGARASVASSTTNCVDFEKVVDIEDEDWTPTGSRSRRR